MKRLEVSLLDRGPLTRREAQVLCLLCHGYSRGEIARQVVRSGKTIDSHVEAIAGKLQCHSAAEIVATAVALDLVEISVTGHGALFVAVCWLLIVVSIVAPMQRLRVPRPINSAVRIARTVRPNAGRIDGVLLPEVLRHV